MAREQIKNREIAEAGTAKKERKIYRARQKSSDKELNPVYCSGCGRFLAYESVVEGIFRIKCRHCKGWSTLAFPALDKK